MTATRPCKRGFCTDGNALLDRIAVIGTGVMAEAVVNGMVTNMGAIQAITLYLDKSLSVFLNFPQG